MGTQGQVLGSR